MSATAVINFMKNSAKKSFPRRASSSSRAFIDWATQTITWRWNRRKSTRRWKMLSSKSWILRAISEELLTVQKHSTIKAYTLWPRSCQSKRITRISTTCWRWFLTTENKSTNPFSQRCPVSMREQRGSNKSSWERQMLPWNNKRGSHRKPLRARTRSSSSPD